MSHDPLQWIESQKAQLWARLSRLPASRRPVVLAPLRDIFARRLALWGTLLVMGMGAALVASAFALRGAHAENMDTALGVLLLGIFVFFVPACSMGINKAHQRLARRLWAVPMDTAEITNLEVWISVYPPARDACIRWAAAHPTLVLNSIDYARLSAICRKVERLDQQLAQHHNLQLVAQEALDKLGLLDEIRSTRDHATLDTASAPEVAPTVPTRL